VVCPSWVVWGGGGRGGEVQGGIDRSKKKKGPLTAEEKAIELNRRGEKSPANWEVGKKKKTLGKKPQLQHEKKNSPGPRRR